MGLVYVTGIPGMGKSAALNELLARGIEAYGVDEHNLADWINKATGGADTWPKPPPADFDAHDWYKNHQYILSRHRVGELSAGARRQRTNIFVFGNADGLENCEALFSKVIALHMDNLAELRRRIMARTDVEFGKTDKEFGQIKALAAAAPGLYRKFGATIIDASQPIDAVADQIVEAMA